jgi:nucleoid DNA-binding protein
MSTPSAQDTIKAFVHVVRDQLEDGNTVEVPGLGTFSVEHHPSEKKESPDGDTYMAPPKDVVDFEPAQ